MQQKTLEAQVQLTKNGERTSRSIRVAEMDQLMPNYLGVSKAVLDFVIFCHQDESLWPMSTSKVLKEKFDEIFEALKYTKAIDNLKTLKKQKTNELKTLKEKENGAKAIKDLGDKAEKKSKTLTAEIEKLKVEITELNAKAKEAREKWREASNHAAQYESDVAKLEFNRNQQGWLQNNIDKLGKNLKQRNESDEWLQSELDNYEFRMAGHQQHLEQQTEQWTYLMRDIKAAREILRNKHSEIGRYEQKETDHQQDIKQRKVMIKESSQRHNIRGYDTDLNDLQISEYMERIVRLSKDQDAAVDKAGRETEREMKKARDLLSKLGEQRSTLNEARNSAKQQSAVNDRRIGIYQSDVNKLEFDDSEKAILEDKIADIEARLKKAKEDSKKASLPTRINDGESQLRGLDQENHHLNQELNQVMDQGRELERLDLYRTEMSERQRSLDKTSSVNSDRLGAVVGKGWTPASLEFDFKKILNKEFDQVKAAERQRDTVTRHLELVDDKLGSARIDLQKAEKDAAACVERLNLSIDGEPEKYLETLAELQHARDHYKAEFDNFLNMRAYFTRALGVAEKKHQCNLCSRAFHGEEQQNFVLRMREKIEKDISEAERDRDESEDDLRKAKDAGPSYETWLMSSNTKIPDLQNVVKKLGTEREKTLRDVEEHDKNVSDRVEARSDVEALANPVAKIVKYHQEMINFSSKINEHNAKRKDGGKSRTVEDVRSEIQILSTKSQSLRNSIDKLRGEKERAQSQISTLELESSNANRDLSAANHQLDKKTNFLKQIEELKTYNREQREKIKEFDEQLQELTPQIIEEEAKLKDIQDRGSEKAKGLRQAAARLSDSVKELRLAEHKIAAYIRDGGPARLEKCRREIDNVQQETRNTEEEQNLVTISVNKIKEELRNHEDTKTTIRNNIDYRESLRELETVKTHIAQLSAQNAEADLSHWQKQSRHWERHFNDNNTQKIELFGQSKAKDNELKGLIEAWNMDYKDAAQGFKRAHIEVEVSRGKHPNFTHSFHPLLTIG